MNFQNDGRLIWVISFRISSSAGKCDRAPWFRVCLIKEGRGKEGEREEGETAAHFPPILFLFPQNPSLSFFPPHWTHRCCIAPIPRIDTISYRDADDASQSLPVSPSSGIFSLYISCFYFIFPLDRFCVCVCGEDRWRVCIFCFDALQHAVVEENADVNLAWNDTFLLWVSSLDFPLCLSWFSEKASCLFL